MSMTTVERGRIAETLAAGFLTLRGYRIVERNFRIARLEVDLIARRENLVVLVEVKYRRGKTAGGAARAVTREKERFLETAAVGYLRLHPHQHLKLRFDVVVIDQERSGAQLVMRHIQGAFRASGRYRF